MQFSLLAILLFVTSIVAAPVEIIQKDTSVILRVVADVNSRLRASIQAIENIQRVRPGTDLFNYAMDIEHTAQDVRTAIELGASEIRRGPNVLTLEAASLLGPFSEMEKQTTRSCDAYISAKPVIVSTQGGREAILRILNDHLATPRIFGDAVKSKLTAINNAFATDRYADKAISDLKRAIEAYKH